MISLERPLRASGKAKADNITPAEAAIDDWHRAVCEFRDIDDLVLGRGWVWGWDTARSDALRRVAALEGSTFADDSAAQTALAQAIVGRDLDGAGVARELNWVLATPAPSAADCTAFVAGTAHALAESRSVATQEA